MAKEKLPALKEGIIAHLKHSKKLSETSDAMKLLALIKQWEAGDKAVRAFTFTKIYTGYNKRCGVLLPKIQRENKLRLFMNEIIAALKEIDYEASPPIKSAGAMTKLEQDVFHDADQASDIYPLSYLEMIFPYKNFKDLAT
jgi:hypothetical protein